MITASHNPAKYNGFKVVAARGSLLEVVGGHSVRQMYDSHGGHRSGGTIGYKNVIPEYAAAVAYAAGWQGVLDRWYDPARVWPPFKRKVEPGDLVAAGATK